MIARAAHGRFRKRDGSQVVAATDLRFNVIFDRAEQLRHCSDKCIREPYLIPAWLEPMSRVSLSSEIQCARRACWIVWPADGATRGSLGSLNAPTNIDITPGTFSRRTSPDVVPRRGATAIIVLENVEINAVLVRELCTRIRPSARQHAARIAKPVAKCVQMMDRHDVCRQRREAFRPRHPVWNCSHLNRAEHRIAQIAAVQKILHRSHGLIVAHVLVHAQLNSGRSTQSYNLLCIVIVHREWLLGQDAADVIVAHYRLADNPELLVWRHC